MQQPAGRENQASTADGERRTATGAKPASDTKMRPGAPQPTERSRLGGLPRRRGDAAGQAGAHAEQPLHMHVQQGGPSQPQERQQGNSQPALDPEWEEELMTTIEEQEEAIRSADMCFPVCAAWPLHMKGKCCSPEPLRVHCHQTF